MKGRKKERNHAKQKKQAKVKERKAKQKETNATGRKKRQEIPQVKKRTEGKAK